MLEANLLGNGDGRAVVKPLHLHLASMREKIHKAQITLIIYLKWESREFRASLPFSTQKQAQLITQP
jgi:hypothetical protein